MVTISRFNKEFLRVISVPYKSYEFYCRYHDQGLFTWNGAVEKVTVYFQRLNEHKSDIKMVVSIANQKWTLVTRVYHDPNKQPFVLPYVVGHPRLVRRQWYRFSLIRAGQYSGLLEDFEDEHLWNQFYKHYNPVRGNKRLNRWTYPSLRRELFRRMNENQREPFVDKDHPVIQLHDLFDWGRRCEFNRQFRQL
jgi:hypothetical protein